VGKCRGAGCIIKTIKEAAFKAAFFCWRVLKSKDLFDMDTTVNNVPQEMYDQIKTEITNKESVVGIDALHTHILVLHRLMQIEAKLDALNEKLELSKAPY
jgi:hypothetical protein